MRSAQKVLAFLWGMTFATPFLHDTSSRQVMGRNVGQYLSKRCTTSMGADPYKRSVVFIRHGESIFNNRNIFTGWCDVDLTEKGRQEAFDAGVLLASYGYHFDAAFTSVLKRATKSTYQVLEGMDTTHTPITTSWRLNERHYGALQGLNKAETEEELGPIVTEWRRSFTARPPPMMDTHAHWPLLKNDQRYRALVAAGRLPRAESLADTQARVAHYWRAHILPRVMTGGADGGGGAGGAGGGGSVLVVAHANTLRALVKAIDGISDAAIEDLAIPNGAPFRYAFDRRGAPRGRPDALGFRGAFLGPRGGGGGGDPCAAAYAARRARCEALFAARPAAVPEECLLPVSEECWLPEEEEEEEEEEEGVVEEESCGAAVGQGGRRRLQQRVRLSMLRANLQAPAVGEAGAGRGRGLLAGSQPQRAVFLGAAAAPAAEAAAEEQRQEEGAERAYSSPRRWEEGDEEEGADGAGGVPPLVFSREEGGLQGGARRVPVGFAENCNGTESGGGGWRRT